MNFVMHGYIGDFVLVYLDNTLMFSDNEDEHKANLRKVFDRLCVHKSLAN